jgi:hypothetical protein
MYQQSSRFQEPKEFPKEHKEFKHGPRVHVGSIVRMIAAGWLVDKLNAREPMHRAAIFAGVRLAPGYVESLLKERKDKERER